ncbi:Alginate_lyase domain-containing protein [Meloidogyne graminicola]|uniref:Alginate_lyase domain-containing protein n=1 Tax=Meloidogyne graminicola TaxID=189291 RepID=A0A8S9ZQH7_9BILA|nr:Alginate_lyase domain-containing protein [Meloidogyne graminicola]
MFIIFVLYFNFLLTFAKEEFKHPGLLHTDDDFERIKNKLEIKEEPWLTAFKQFNTSRFSSPNYVPRPQKIIYTGIGFPQNYIPLGQDIAAAYCNALNWKITGNNVYAEKSINNKKKRSSTLESMQGNNDIALTGGIFGCQFANVGEIMRSYKGWKAEDFNKFKKMMVNIFYNAGWGFIITNEPSKGRRFYYSNWDLAQIGLGIAIGVLTDNKTMFENAIKVYKSDWYWGGSSQFIYYLHSGYFGQTQETGRDQGHNTLSIGLGGILCEMAWNQGVDLYGWDNNRYLAGAEYVAKLNYNFNNSGFAQVPYLTYYNYYGAGIVQTEIGPEKPKNRPIWSLVYNHYENRIGIATPWSKKYAIALRPEIGSGDIDGGTGGSYNFLGFGTLLYQQDPISSSCYPKGLTARVNGTKVELNWWGPVYTKKYSVLANGTKCASSNIAKAFIGKKLYFNLSVNNKSIPIDLSENKFSINLINGASVGKGIKGKQTAILLNGNGQYVELPNNLLSELSDYSISTWLYCNQNLPTNARLFDFGAGLGHYIGFSMKISSGVWQFKSTVGGEFAETTISGPGPLQCVNQWIHLAITQLGENLIIYLNGTISGQTKNPMPPFRIGNTTNNCLGRSQFYIPPYNRPYFSGLIDEFKIFEGALNQEEIKKIM